MKLKSKLSLALWIVLVAFFTWDWFVSEPINHRLEPPLVAIGSGQAPSGGHCASTF
ncbi:hypothetical protein [Allopusillimonas soli]|uniref:Uncharacterized protein n=1 Tax=Allopusillimonas soli TaxID=659016 RepID=A0A853FMA4_9BURK|nr:hypothetical protein [Allopusillimonas soli]NYT39026.1 hypothetical protein [Allopusillimonas soli]